MLVDPGPTSCLPALTRRARRARLRLDDVRALLITHIHLDHAGATGSPRAAPSRTCRSTSTTIGARHLARSREAAGECHPSLRGGHGPICGGRSSPCRKPRFVPWPAASPCHDWRAELRRGLHAGARRPPRELPRYRRSHGLRRGHGWHRHWSLRAGGDTAARHRPRALAGESRRHRCVGAVVALPHALRSRSRPQAGIWRAIARCSAVLPQRARDAIRTGGDEPALIEAWVRWLREDARRVLSEEAAAGAEAAAPFDQIWQGLARYWRKRVEREGVGALDAPLPLRAAAFSWPPPCRAAAKRGALGRGLLRRVDQEAQRVALRRRQRLWLRSTRHTAARTRPAARGWPVPAAGLSSCRCTSRKSGSGAADEHSTNAPPSLRSRVMAETKRTVPPWSFQVSRAGTATAGASWCAG